MTKPRPSVAPAMSSGATMPVRSAMRPSTIVPKAKPSIINV